MSDVRRFSPFFIFAAALVLAVPARADFECLHRIGDPLPYRLAGVEFVRPDRREAAVAAVRGMAARWLEESGLFDPEAGSALTVELREVDTRAVVRNDGTGLGMAAILYRVEDGGGRVLFNDRIETRALVRIEDALRLEQSSGRAARYRAFARNLAVFSGRLARAAGRGGASPAVTMSRNLETPARTGDFLDRAAAALGAAGVAGTVRITALDLRETSAPGAPTAAARVRAVLEAEAKGVPYWRGEIEGLGQATRETALFWGIDPAEAAIADALVRAARAAAPGMRNATGDARVLAARAFRLPRALAGIAAEPGTAAAATDAAGVLTAMNRPGMPLARLWTGGEAVRVGLSEVRERVADGNVRVSAMFTVTDAEGEPRFSARGEGTALLSGGTAGEAGRVAWREAWVEFLGLFAAAANPLRTKAEAPSPG